MKLEDVMLVVTLALLAVTPLLLSHMARRQQREVKRTVVVVECSSCGYRDVRTFSKGYYVGQVIGKCPRCGAELRVTAIYVERVRANGKEGRERTRLER